MDRAIPLGRLAGVKISMSWVVPFVACLYALSLAQTLLPRAVPFASDTLYWVVGAAGALLLFLSLLAHEMGHALVGRREGIGVRGITLTLLGGYTQFDTETHTAGAELRVSGIGPLTNLVCAGVFQLAATPLVSGADGGLLALTGEMLSYLAWVNLLLAAVNMLPGAPLDGGAVLGAVIWMATRDRNRAQTITAVIGLVVGAAMAALGFLFLVDQGREGGLWLLIIGLFIVGGARGQLRAAPTVGALRDARMGEVMLADPPVVPEWSLLSDVVARAPAWQPHTAFPVQASDGRISGLLTAELVLAVDPAAWPSMRAVDVAWPIGRVVTAVVDEPVLNALQRSQAADSDRILVLWPDGRVAGIAGPDAAGRVLRADPSPSA